jgi:hypothetical protein
MQAEGVHYGKTRPAPLTIQVQVPLVGSGLINL